jgi:glutaredoxin
MLIAIFRSWWTGRRHASVTTVTFYTRAGCHLCDVAHATLEGVRPEYGFLLDVVDVDANEELRERYKDHVPVVFVNGKLRFHGRINLVLLRRLLRAEASKKRR